MKPCVNSCVLVLEFYLTTTSLPTSSSSFPPLCFSNFYSNLTEIVFVSSNNSLVQFRACAYLFPLTFVHQSLSFPLIKAINIYVNANEAIIFEEFTFNMRQINGVQDETRHLTTTFCRNDASFCIAENFTLNF
jgi:hypothetical protein